MKLKSLLISMSVLATTPAFAITYHVTPDGTGTKDGLNWENAMGLAEFLSDMTWKKVNDAHNDNEYLFAGGTYTFTKTGFIFNSGLTLEGGYDAATGLKSSTDRTIFDGANKPRSNGAFFLQPNSVQDKNGKKRAITITSIDFENFVTNGVWRNDETNWNYGMPSALYICKGGYVEITDCNFRNNSCVATGTYKDDNQNGTAHDKVMAGAVSLNRVNAIFRNCSFTGNKGTQGGDVKCFYDMGGDVNKNLYTTFEGCYFANNSTSDNGGAIMGRHTTQVNVINSTFTGNTADKSGGAIYMNGVGFYANTCNIVSSTIAANTSPSGSQIYTNGKGAVNAANSIIVGNDETAAIADASSTGAYKFQGNNAIGKVAEGYASTGTDKISDQNTYAAIFEPSTRSTTGTITPVKFIAGMSPETIASVVDSESWPFTVDCAVDQLGNPRTTNTSNGAIAITDPSTGISNIIANSNSARLIRLGTASYAIEGTGSEKVSVYSVSGTLMAVTSSEYIDLNNMAKGLYIIHAEKSIFKVIR